MFRIILMCLRDDKIHLFFHLKKQVVSLKPLLYMYILYVTCMFLYDRVKIYFTFSENERKDSQTSQNKGANKVKILSVCLFPLSIGLFNFYAFIHALSSA